MRPQNTARSGLKEPSNLRPRQRTRSDAKPNLVRTKDYEKMIKTQMQSRLSETTQLSNQYSTDQPSITSKRPPKFELNEKVFNSRFLYKEGNDFLARLHDEQAQRNHQKPSSYSQIAPRKEKPVYDSVASNAQYSQSQVLSEHSNHQRVMGPASINSQGLDLTIYESDYNQKEMKIEENEERQINQIQYQLIKDGEITSDNWFLIKIQNLDSKASKNFFEEAILHDYFGYWQKDKFKVVSLKIKLNGLLREYEADLDLPKDVNVLTFMIRVCSIEPEMKYSDAIKRLELKFDQQQEQLEKVKYANSDFEIIKKLEYKLDEQNKLQSKITAKMESKLNQQQHDMEQIKQLYSNLRQEHEKHVKNEKTNNHTLLGKVDKLDYKFRQKETKDSRELNNCPWIENEKRFTQVTKKLEELEERVARQFEQINQELVLTKGDADKRIAEALQKHESILNKLHQVNEDLNQEISLVRADAVETKDQFNKHCKELELERNKPLKLTLENMDNIKEGEVAKLPPMALPKTGQQKTKANSDFPVGAAAKQPTVKQANITEPRADANTSLNLPSQKTMAQRETYDMAFLFANPIVKKSKDEQYIPTYMPLDLEEEYNQIVSNIGQAGKEFKIKKEAVTRQSLAGVVTDSPKIIHISCHGDFDKTLNAFYLAFEVEGTGEERKFDTNDLKLVLENAAHSIKVAFINACHSEQMGNIIFDAGIPVVICVNQDEKINDECCKEFSKSFYKSLIQGATIKKSFQSAIRQLHLSENKDFDPCCCAHGHSEGCWWYRLYQENSQEAHELHIGACKCKNENMRNRQHNLLCPQIKKYNTKRKDILEQIKKEEREKTKDQNGGSTQLAQAKKILENKKRDNNIGSVNAFFADMADFDGDDDLLVDDDEMLFKENMMCCCKQELIHDESLKYTLKYSESHRIGPELRPEEQSRVRMSEQDAKWILNEIQRALPDSKGHVPEAELKKWVEKRGIEWEELKKVAFVDEMGKINYIEFLKAAQTGFSILDCTIFKSKADGKVQHYMSMNSTVSQIPSILDKSILVGRHQEIFELVNFLNGKEVNLNASTNASGPGAGKINYRNKKFYLMHAFQGSGASDIIKHAIKYVLERHAFKNNAYYIDMQNQQSTDVLLKGLSKKLHTLDADREAITKILQDQDTLIMIDRCDVIAEKDSRELQALMEYFAQNIEKFKIIIKTSLKEPFKFDDGQRDLEHVTVQKKIDRVEPKYSAQLMFDIMRGNLKFDKQFKSVHDLARHKLFEERFTTFEISLICKQMLDRGNKNQYYDFDSMVEEQKLKKQNINALVELQYRHISTKYGDIMPIILILALMTNGMTLSDLQRIIFYVDGPAEVEDSPEVESFVKFVGENNGESGFGLGCQFVIAHNDGHDLLDHFILDKSLRQYIQSNQMYKDPALGEDGTQIANSYLSYMSSLSKYFVAVLRKELNLHILSSEINYGIWASDHEIGDLMDVTGATVDNEKYFSIHEANFNELLQVTGGIPTRLDELIGGESEESDGTYATYIAEIIVNIPSILIMLNRLADAKTLIRKCIEICDNYMGKVPIQMANIKLHLMEASISIHQGNCQNKVTISQIEEQLNHIWSDDKNSGVEIDREELLHEYSSLGICEDAKGEVHFLRAIYLIKVLESYLRTQNLDGGLDEDVSPTRDRKPPRGSFAFQARGTSVKYEHEPKNVIKLKKNNKSINNKMMELRHKEFAIETFEDILHHFSESIEYFQESSKQAMMQEKAYYSSAKSSKQVQYHQHDNFQSPSIRKGRKKSKILQSLKILTEAQQKNFRSTLEKDVNFTKDQRGIYGLGIAKATYLKVDFIFNYSKHLDPEALQHHDFKSSELCKELEDNESIFEETKNYTIYAEQKLIQAEQDQQDQRWAEGRKKAKHCVELFRKQKKHVEQKQASQIFEKCSKKLKAENKNMIITAIALPIGNDQTVAQQGRHDIFQNISMSLQLKMRAKFEESRKQIDYKFEVLNEKFWETYTSSKVLHIRPVLFNYIEENKHMYIEDENFYSKKVTPESLKETILANTNQQISTTSLVVIGMPNCKLFAEMFASLKVPHVLYFETKDSKWQKERGKSLTDVDHQRRFTVVQCYMKEFVMQFYDRLLKNAVPFVVAFSEAQEASRKILAYEETMTVEPTLHPATKTKHPQYKQSKQHFFDTKDKASLLEEGEAVDLSPVRASTQLDEYKMQWQFEKTDFKRFLKLANLLTKSYEPNKAKVSIINVFGREGRGRSKLVSEVAAYLRYRYYFPKGVFFIDMETSKSFIDDLNDIKNQMIEWNSVTKLNTFRRNKLAKNKSTTSSALKPNYSKTHSNSQSPQKQVTNKAKKQKVKLENNNCLIIIDNCDDMLKTNSKSFQANLDVLKAKITELTIILITQNSIEGMKSLNWHFGTKIEPFKLEQFDADDAKLYYQCITDQLNYSFGQQSKYTSNSDTEIIHSKLKLLNYKPPISDDQTLQKLHSLIDQFEGDLSLLAAIHLFARNNHEYIPKISILHKSQMQDGEIPGERKQSNYKNFKYWGVHVKNAMQKSMSLRKNSLRAGSKVLLTVDRLKENAKAKGVEGVKKSNLFGFDQDPTGFGAASVQLPNQDKQDSYFADVGEVIDVRSPQTPYLKLREQMQLSAIQDLRQTSIDTQKKPRAPLNQPIVEEDSELSIREDDDQPSETEEVETLSNDSKYDFPLTEEREYLEESNTSKGCIKFNNLFIQVIGKENKTLKLYHDPKSEIPNIEIYELQNDNTPTDRGSTQYKKVKDVNLVEQIFIYHAHIYRADTEDHCCSVAGDDSSFGSDDDSDVALDGTSSHRSAGQIGKQPIPSKINKACTK